MRGPNMGSEGKRNIVRNYDSGRKGKLLLMPARVVYELGDYVRRLAQARPR